MLYSGIDKRLFTFLHIIVFSVCFQWNVYSQESNIQTRYGYELVDYYIMRKNKNTIFKAHLNKDLEFEFENKYCLADNKWVRYSEDSSLIEVGEFKRHFEGSLLRRFFQRTKYKYYIKMGTWKYYDENNALWKIEIYEDGELKYFLECSSIN